MRASAAVAWRAAAVRVPPGPRARMLDVPSFYLEMFLSRQQSSCACAGMQQGGVRDVARKAPSWPQCCGSRYSPELAALSAGCSRAAGTRNLTPARGLSVRGDGDCQEQRRSHHESLLRMTRHVGSCQGPRPSAAGGGSAGCWPCTVGESLQMQLIALAGLVGGCRANLMSGKKSSGTCKAPLLGAGMPPQCRKWVSFLKMA